jgi:hypothetical protein
MIFAGVGFGFLTGLGRLAVTMTGGLAVVVIATEPIALPTAGREASSGRGSSLIRWTARTEDRHIAASVVPFVRCSVAR